MAKSNYSKDTLANILVDKINTPNPQDKVQVTKQKIVFGPDGSYTDVTDSTPFPVTGTFTPGNPGWSNFGSGTPTTIPVTDTSTLLLAANPDRVSASIINNTSQTIYIQYGIDAEWQTGFPVRTNGIFKITLDDLFLGQVNAITDVGSVNIDVIEGES